MLYQASLTLGHSIQYPPARLPNFQEMTCKGPLSSSSDAQKPELSPGTTVKMPLSSSWVQRSIGTCSFSSNKTVQWSLALLNYISQCAEQQLYPLLWAMAAARSARVKRLSHIHSLPAAAAPCPPVQGWEWEKRVGNHSWWHGIRIVYMLLGLW